MVIKVCGMRDPENIRDVETLGIDLMGFIFFEKSKRYVQQVPSYLPHSCKRVGVFVNAPLSFIMDKVQKMGLDCIQLHGEETPEEIIAIREALPSKKIFKAFHLHDRSDLEKAAPYQGKADLFLFDTPCKEYGGCGRSFDWSILEDYGLQTPFLLSGGIGPEKIDQIRQFHHPRCIGLDLNSRFESAPAFKDTIMLKAFLDEIRNA